MNFSALTRTGFAVALSAVLASMAAPVMAQEQGSSIFSQVSPSIRDRMFFRINYIRANVKTTSGEAYDVTGPVISRGELKARLGTGGSYTYPYGGSGRRSSYNLLSPQLDDALTSDADNGCEAERAGLGTPCGIRARGAAMVGTPALSIGYYLDDEYNWALEAYVLAAPLKVSIYGDGNNQLNGQKITTLKMLPPTAVLGRYFGNKTDSVRPFAGFGASYAVFYDVKASDYLNYYQGGASAGDTSVSIRNVMGYGPFAGLKANVSDDWHVNLSVGKLTYRTDATIVTRNTTITADSPVLKDFGPYAQSAISAGEAAVGISTIMCDLASARAGVKTCNSGTYVRKVSTKLDNTLFTVGIGRSF